MLRTKRFSSFDEFEEVYLRVRTLDRMLKTIDLSTVDATLRDSEFLKCTSYLARNLFAKNRGSLLQHGFSEEDIRSISQVYGISFLGSKFEAKTSKDKYYLMMRYINQRFRAFMIFLDRKFDYTKKYSEVYLDDFSDRVRESLIQQSHNSRTNQNTKHGTPEEMIRIVIDALRFKLSVLREMSQRTSTPEIQKYRAELIATKETLRKKLATLRQAQISQTKDRKKKTSQLKKRFKKEWPCHVDKLCYYSTSKQVEPDLRRKARDYCKRLKVDYIGWARRKIEANEADQIDFVL